MVKRYLVAGGTGFIGNHLRRFAEGKGDRVTILTRGEVKKEGDDLLRWNPEDKDSLKDLDFGSFDVVVNLSGEGIEKRWTRGYKERLLTSRVVSTSTLVSLINRAERKPRYFVNASAIGYYGNGEEEVNESSPPGNDFLAELSVRWEGEARKLDSSVKLLIPRFGVVLGNDGGALPKLETMAKLGVIPKKYDSNAWKSWIEVGDAVRSVSFMIDKGFIGHYNVVSPNPASIEDFIGTIFRVMNKKPRLRMGKWVFRLFLGEGAEYSIFGGQKVVPSKLIELGFKYDYPELGAAVTALMAVQ
ncbi:MAG: TIGR01777 family oxidoreductase [Thermoplasmata archaeon]